MENLNPALKELLNRGQVVLASASDELFGRTVSDLSTAMKHRRCVLFTGAGISSSYPSCVPLTDTVINPIKTLLRESVEDILDNSSFPPDSSATIARVLDKCRMERLLDVLVDVYGGIGREVISVLDGQIWNDNHEALATLAVNGYLPHCMTLNFDILLEAAIGAKGGQYATVCPLLPHTIGTPSSADTIILKPHGSFRAPSEKDDRIRFISATLSEAGDLPREANRTAIRDVLRQCPYLLVAGYSDNDWDIFPIIQQNSDILQGVVWVAYTAQETLDSALACVGNVDNGTLSPKVAQWLLEQGSKAKLMLGNVTDLLQAVIRQSCGVQLPRTEVAPEREEAIRESHLRILENAVARIRTDRTHQRMAVVSLLACVRERPIQRAILRHMLSEATQKSIKTFCCRGLAGSFHMESAYRRAIIWNRRAIENLDSSHRNVKALADASMWLGYGHLCLAKGPRLNSMRGIKSWLLNLYSGFYHIGRSKSFSAKSDFEIAGRGGYFIIDLLHVWANGMLLYCKHDSALIRTVYSLLYLLYGHLFRKYPRLKQVEYYWMRYLETRLLGRRQFRRSLRLQSETRLNEILESCTLTLNDVHIGNVHLSRSLISFVLDSDRSGAISHLYKAFRHWSGESGAYVPSTSGLRKIAIFGHVVGLIRNRQVAKSQAVQPEAKTLKSLFKNVERVSVDAVSEVPGPYRASVLNREGLYGERA